MVLKWKARLMNHSKNKVVLVTGASSGIGKATAKALLSKGYIVYCVARRVENMQDHKELGGIPIKMDVTKEEEMLAGIKQIQQAHGGVDILINNAGFATYGAVEDISIDEARYQFEVNLFGLARLTQLVLPHMREQAWGKVVNISSVGGKIYTPLGAWYHATKHALEGWSDCLRLELKPFNIDVIIIEPGAIVTEFTEVMLEPMLKRAGKGPYQKLAQSMANATKSSYEKKGLTSAASVIAKVIVKAVQLNKPKTRYAAGKFAKPLIWVRKYLSDRIFDKMIMSQIK